MFHIDANTWLVLLMNACGWVVIWFRKEQQRGFENWKFEKMWNEYEIRHGINGKRKTEEA